MRTLAAILLFAALPASFARAEDAPTAPESEQINVDQLRKKYWAKGDETELRVVQNRHINKENRMKLAAFGGFVSADPFLAIKGVGGSLGYFLSEYVAVQGFYWQYLVSGSSALSTLESNGFTTQINRQKSFYGGEFVLSPLYGKLSVFGSAIVYYDLYATLGAGMTKTETGSYFTPVAGLGQQIYLARQVAITLDFKIMRYTEKLNRPVGNTVGVGVDQRSIWTSAFYLGLMVLI